MMNLETAKTLVPLGRYRHHKGGFYEVIAVGLLEADLTPMVIYSNKEGQTWVRTAEDFTQLVAIEGGMVRRFEKT